MTAKIIDLTPDLPCDTEYTPQRRALEAHLATPYPEKVMSLIERSESARTREEAVDVFRDYSIARDYDVPEGFDAFFMNAVTCDNDDYAPGYLLLAAMAVVPEGWIIVNLGQNDDGTWFVELRKGYRTSYTQAVVVLKGPLHCTALLAAILKVEEGNG